MDDDAHRYHWNAMLARVEADSYPSSLMLDLLERSMTWQERPRLVKVLVDKAHDAQFPSPDLLNRIARIAG